jgi:hypothetical protein
MLVVGGLSMAMLLAASANNWPALAIQLYGGTGHGALTTSISACWRED